jgi:hypothetical protein
MNNSGNARSAAGTNHEILAAAARCGYGHRAVPSASTSTTISAAEAPPLRARWEGRALTAAEVAALSRDLWQLFRKD